MDMTEEQMQDVAQKAHESVDDLLAEMTAVLEKRGHQGVRVTSFSISPKAAQDNAPPPAPVPKPGCVVLPNGTIFCG
jgi:hypothetical protein